MTLFTDESAFLLHPKTTNKKNDVVWARGREDVPPVEVKQYSPKVRVWGGVSAQGNTRLLMYSGDLTGSKYRTLLNKAKPDFSKVFGSSDRNWTFVHDGASPHKARATNEWAQTKRPKSHRIWTSRRVARQLARLAPHRIGVGIHGRRNWREANPGRFVRSNAKCSRSGKISMKTLCKNRLMAWENVSSQSLSLVESSQRITAGVWLQLLQC